MRNMKRSRRHRSAFTLLELMLVLAIVVVLAGVVGYNILGQADDANAKVTLSQLQNLKNAVTMYKLKVNEMPDTLEALVNGPSDPNKKAMFGSPVMSEIPKDAWGREITFTANGNKFELRSAGIDGQMNSDDDIIVSS